MEWVNPITAETFPDESSYVDSLIASFRQLQIDKRAVQEDEELLNKAINDVAGQPLVQKGTIRVDGTGARINVVRKLNVTYFKESGQEHPLILLAKKHECLRDKIRPVPQERGSKIAKLVKAFEDGELDCDSPEGQAIQELISYRKVSSAKPSISVVDKNVVSTESAPDSSYDGVEY